MNLLHGWVGEQVSDDHNVLPELSSAPVIDADGEIGSFESASVTTSVPKSTPKPQSGGGFGKVLVGAVAAAAIAAGGFAAWPYIAELFESETPTQLALVENRPPTQTLMIDGDTMYLEGSVPDEAASNSFEQAASAAIGPDRVVNNFEISDDAVYDPDQPVQLQVAETVRFGTGRADISDQYRPLIDLAVDLMTNRESIDLMIIGHTDDVGDEETNLALSQQRAQRTADEIVARGVAEDRLAVDGRGESEPLESNETPEGRQANRRVEFMVTGLLN